MEILHHLAVAEDKANNLNDPLADSALTLAKSAYKISKQARDIGHYDMHADSIDESIKRVSELHEAYNKRITKLRESLKSAFYSMSQASGMLNGALAIIPIVGSSLGDYWGLREEIVRYNQKIGEVLAVEWPAYHSTYYLDSTIMLDDILSCLRIVSNCVDDSWFIKSVSYNCRVSYEFNEDADDSSTHLVNICHRMDFSLGVYHDSVINSIDSVYTAAKLRADMMQELDKLGRHIDDLQSSIVTESDLKPFGFSILSGSSIKPSEK